ncbi:MAG TPA: hypothetical protein VMY06_13455 [Sedimentisphaerales bacterium]|nr:hypothetical protein [Sedimentisphaerales bacterium]
MKYIPRFFNHYCRWCGKAYFSLKPTDRDGFHSKACKQAHHRAYQKYVTGKHQAGSRSRPLDTDIG